jgi:hypothetical protein
VVAWVAAWNGVSQVGGLGEAQWGERIQPSLNVQFGNWPHRILSNWARITGKKFGQTDLSSVFLDLHWASSIKNGFGLNYCDFHDFSESQRDQWRLNFSRVLNPVEKTRSYEKQLYLFLGKALENGIWLISIESDIHQETSVSDLCTWMKHCSKRLHQYPVKI